MYIMISSVLPGIWILLRTFIVRYYFLPSSGSLISAWGKAVCTWNHLKWLKGLKGGYFRKIGISERRVFPSVSVDVWSLQSVAVIRGNHFLWSSSLQACSDLRLACCWFRSSCLEAVFMKVCRLRPGACKVYLQFRTRKYKINLASK